MRLKGKKALAVILALLFVLLAVSGCGGSKQAGDQKTSTQPVV